MPEVSVIVPVYNTAACLPRCLDSLLAQTFGDFEAILVDDGSTDESPAILSAYAEKDPRFLVVTRENGGLSAARNSGIRLARGEYLAFLDSDDAFDPAFLEKMAGKAKREKLDLVLCAFTYVYPDGRRVSAPTRHHLSGEPVREYLLSEPMAPVRLFRRALFQEVAFREGIYYEDLELTPSFAGKTDRIGFIDECLYDYYRRDGSIMQSAFSPKWLDIFAALESLVARLGGDTCRKYYREVEFLHIEHLLRSAALRFCGVPERKELFCHLRKTMAERFADWRRNPYLKKMPLSFKLVVRLAGGGHCRAVACLARLKGGKG